MREDRGKTTSIIFLLTLNSVLGSPALFGSRWNCVVTGTGLNMQVTYDPAELNFSLICVLHHNFTNAASKDATFSAYFLCAVSSGIHGHTNTHGLHFICICEYVTEWVFVLYAR